MAFENLNDFISMCYVAPIGDTRCHGGYVWSAYAVAFTVVLLNIVGMVRQRRKIIQQIRRKARREQAK
ncbi:MAG: heme exporter protein CcmD [Pseudomonadales bacterium]|nr:heme exporter protein CcmD [Pseudomonadales bacterium]